MNMGQERPSRPNRGLLKKWQLIFYGTEESPVRVPRNTGFSSGSSSGFSGSGSGFGSPSSSSSGFRTGKQLQGFSSSSNAPRGRTPIPAGPPISGSGFSFPSPSFSFPNFFSTFRRLKRWALDEEEEDEFEDFDDLDQNPIDVSVKKVTLEDVYL